MMNQIFSPPLWISLLLSILSCTSLVGASCIQHFDTCIEALEDAECYYKHHDYDYCHHYKHYKYDNSFTIHYFKAFVDILSPQGEDFSRKKYAKNAKKHYDYCDKKSWWTSIDDCYGDSSYMCCSKLYKEPVYSAYEQIYNETRDQFESEFSLHDLFLHNNTHTVTNMCGKVQTLLKVCDDYLNIAFEVQYNVTSSKAATMNEKIELFLHNTIANFGEVKSIRFINGNGEYISLLEFTASGILYHLF